jgi:hypothetical protein
MNIFENQTFTGRALTLDDTKFVRCTFIACTITYFGGFFDMIDCVISPETLWVLRDSAQRTTGLLRMIGMLRPEADRLVETSEPIN